ncbi:pentapeptide repeat-containing protein [Candidatus Villigracilis affinis]|uniref:pentapeptide repeat-containing protein n=1 Tax=Candidatus Villigracilis affinis TaxID=3140682 RepID=UPI001D908E74|nr:pentapeptide repeat-containing protein [Anaerolineales bacterium]
MKADIEGWNKWREQHDEEDMEPCEVDFLGAVILKAILRDAKLRPAHLREANLRDANLRNANLYGADLWGANLYHSNLYGANLYGATLERANLSGADLTKADLRFAYLKAANLVLTRFQGVNLSNASLHQSDLSAANFRDTNLCETDLSDANLYEADFRKADLRGANLTGANLYKAKLNEANLTGVNLTGANLNRADLTGANLTEADLSSSSLIGTNITNTKFYKSRVYGISAWDLQGETKEQKDLVITPDGQSAITVDNIEIAQFIYLILNNKNIRDVINTLTSKTVLILGRFALPERKIILDTLRDKLRGYDLLPIVFDFDRPTDKDFTETIKTLAGISYFVIADVTNPKSSPLELQATVPDYQIPFVPIIQEGESPFAMMVDLQKKYPWVLPTRSYDSIETLMSA